MRWLAPLCSIALLSCGLDPVFVCSESSECVDGDELGRCESTGFCSFPDDSCIGTRRYGELAGDGLAEQCIDDLDPCERTAQSVIAGNRVTCTVMEDTTVRCRGAGEDGQLGDGTQESSLDSVVVQTVFGEPLTGVAELAAGPGSHLCARENNGRLWCWGSNSDGQLGIRPGQSGARAGLVESSLAVEFTGVLQIEVGGRHTCARLADDSVWCWGADDRGQLGIGAPTPNQTNPTPLATDFVDIELGLDFSCGRQTDDRVLCWGANELNQLGTGTLAGSALPTPVQSGGADLAADGELESGNNHSCVQKARAVLCWGTNDQGQHGNGTLDPVAFTSVVVLNPDEELAALQAGGDNACVLQQRDETVLCWGENDGDRTGSGNDVSAEPLPVRVISMIDGQPLEGVTNVSVGREHSCARLQDGSVWCWGENSGGQLGRRPGELPSTTGALPVCP